MIEKVMDGPQYMWSLYDKSDLFLTTTNTTLNEAGALVMAAGHAKQVRNRFRGIDKALGGRVQKNAQERVWDKTWKDVESYGLLRNGKTYHVYADYFLLVSPDWPKKKLGAFQVKRGWWMKGDNEVEKDMMLRIISTSAVNLNLWCLAHPEARVDMPFPGIGNGGLSIDDVRPYIETLPDTVYVWRLENGS